MNQSSEGTDTAGLKELFQLALPLVWLNANTPALDPLDQFAPRLNQGFEATLQLYPQKLARIYLAISINILTIFTHITRSIISKLLCGIFATPLACSYRSDRGTRAAKARPKRARTILYFT